jgi:2-oxoglutarate dehydrogenase E2 component (dihydrolipoamide succinyltransferase)
MSAIFALRKKYQERFVERHGTKLGFMSFFLKAVIDALQEYPAVNSQIDGDHIVYKNYYNIGVAVSSPKGLMVPVVKNADQLSFSEVELEIKRLAGLARNSKLKLEHFQNGTFTISNGGVFGSLLSTPILNPPQVAILGMHTIQERPVNVNGEVAIRPMMYLALSYDHRIIDGKEAVSFLVRIKELVENPERILFDV